MQRYIDTLKINVAMKEEVGALCLAEGLFDMPLRC